MKKAQPGASDARDTATGSPKLTELELYVLALAEANYPTSAYEVIKILSASPAAGFSGSSGTIYPMVRRLERKGLLKSVRIDGHPRSRSHLELSDPARTIVRHWLTRPAEGDDLPPDPIRTKLLFFGLLSKRERLDFLKEADERVKRKIQDVERYAEAHPGSYADLAYEGAIEVLRARQRWLSKVISQISRE